MFIALSPLPLNIPTAQSSDGRDFNPYAGPVSSSGLAGAFLLRVAQVLAVDVKCLIVELFFVHFLP